MDENTNQTSQFYGPVNFTNKLTNVSDLGIETKNLFIKGTAAQPKLLTVGISTPTDSAKTPGDIQFVSNPVDDYIGHTYVDGEWRQWGFISRVPDSKTLMFDHLGVGVVPEPENLIRLRVSDLTIVEDIRVTGNLQLDQGQELGDVTFEDITVNGTGFFTNSKIDPLTGLTPYRTILCEGGTQEFFNVEVVGFTTFQSRVDFNSNVYGVGGRFGNINVGIFNDNSITKVAGTGTLVLDSDPNDRNGVVRVEDNFEILANTNANVYQTWSTRDTLGLSTSVSAKLEVKTINVGSDSVTFDLGINNTSGSTTLALHTDDDNYSAGTFVIEDLANGNTNIKKRGQNKRLTLDVPDSGADMLFTVGTNQNFHITSLGQYHFEQSNSGNELSGHHLKLDQKGDGDVVLSWHRSKNNGNIRWYAGIDADDGNSWKLANPATTTAAGSEQFTRASETKLKIDTSGNTSILGDLDVGGDTISTPTTTTFNLVNTNISTLNFAQTATTITIGNNSNTSSISLRGITDSSSSTTGALKVAGGVGIAKNLYVGGKIGPAVFNSTVKVEGTADFDENVNIDGTVTFTKTTNNTLGNANTGAFQVDGGVGINKNVTIGSNLYVGSNATVIGSMTAASFIKQGGGSTNGQSHFLRADGTDTILQLQDFVNALTYVPQPPITLTGYPKGNSFRLLSIASQFNGSKKIFDLYAPDSTPFTPEGAANLLVYLNGDTLLEPDADYIILIQSTNPLTYQPRIQFISAPLAGQDCHIVALGGQGMVLDDEGWTAKGQIAVGRQQNRAEMLSVGANDQVLVANSSETLGVKWMYMQQEPPIGSVHYFASSTAPEGYLVCDGTVVNSGTRTIQGKTADFTVLHNLLGTTFGGTSGTLPNLMNRVAMGGSGGSNYNVGAKGGSNSHTINVRDLPAHKHPLTLNGKHRHTVTVAEEGYHAHNNIANVNHDHSPAPISTHNGHNHNIQLGDVPNHSHGTETGQDGYHDHNVETNQGGDHQHPVSTGLGGAHNHQSTHAVGDGGGHQHQLEIKQEGYHSHAATAGEDGKHSHNTQVGQHSHNVERVAGRGGQGENERSGDFYTTETGQSSPNVSIEQGGKHNHNLSIQQGGKHSHPGSTTYKPDHKHPFSIQITQSNTHSHPVSLGKHEGHKHTGATNQTSKHAHNISGDGKHAHPAVNQTGGSHSHTITIPGEGSHTHTINQNGKHDHNTNVSEYDDHNHQVGETGGNASGGGTSVDLRNPYLGLLPVIKAYYVGPKTTKNW